MKYQAVKIAHPEPAATGWEVRSKSKGYWFTICETFAFEGDSADIIARRIALMLNFYDKHLKQKPKTKRKP